MAQPVRPGLSSIFAQFRSRATRVLGPAGSRLLRRRPSLDWLGSLRGRRALLEGLEVRSLLSASFYVAVTGSDNNPGTLAAPLRTIQKAADLAQAGDTVFIGGGTYDQTITPANSGAPGDPITYEPYDNQTVVISGADPVTGWTNVGNSVYAAPQAWDLGEGQNQVFVDGQALTEAQFPNTSLDLSHPSFSNAATMTLDGALPGTNQDIATLTDPALTQPDGAWKGATIHIFPGQGWVAKTGTVLSYAHGELTFAYTPSSSSKAIYGVSQTPASGDSYYLTGAFKALNGPGEWYRDPTSGTLYLRSPGNDNPGSHDVEAKARQYAFDLRGISDINIRGIQIFAATIITDAASSDISLSGIDASYLSQSTIMADGYNFAQTAQSGIQLLGNNDVLKDSTLAFSTGNGVYIGGTNDSVLNDVIHDVDTTGVDCAAVLIRGSDQTVANNTIYNAGRDGIKFSTARNVTITSNLIHDVMLQTTDGGGIYTWGTNNSGSEVAYNQIYNIHSGGYGAGGIYLDGNSSNLLVDHNVVYNCDYGIKLNPPSTDNRILNNTLIQDKQAVTSSNSATMPGTVFENNILLGSVTFGPGAAHKDNFWSDPGFVNAAGGNFQLSHGSPAIDAGLDLGDVTAGYVGAAPDEGAREFGSTPFVAGSNLGTSISPTQPVTPPPVTTPPVTTPPVKTPPVTTPPVKTPPVTTPPVTTPPVTTPPVTTPDSPPGGPVQPASYIRAINYDGESGIQSDYFEVGYVNGGDWLQYNNVNFGSGAKTFQALLSVANDYAGGIVQVRIDSVTGPVIGSLTVAGTGGWNTYQAQSTSIRPVSGVHTLFITFQGGAGIANFRKFMFS